MKVIKKVKKGDVVYEQDFNDVFNKSYFEHRVLKVNKDSVKTEDLSQGGKETTLTSFKTKEELDK